MSTADLKRKSLVDWYNTTLGYAGDPSLAAHHEAIRADLAKIEGLIEAHDADNA